MRFTAWPVLVLSSPSAVAGSLYSVVLWPVLVVCGGRPDWMPGFHSVVETGYGGVVYGFNGRYTGWRLFETNDEVKKRRVQG